MNLLSDEPLPTAFEYDDTVYEMHTDFREWIKFEMLMTDEDIPQELKGGLLLQLIFPVVPPAPDVGSFLIWFYSCGKKAAKVRHNGKAVPAHNTNAAIYSYEYDDGYIYAAFKELYGIDLNTIEYLHWWKFRALFKALHDCKLTEIMGYRAAKIDSKLPEKQKARLTELKHIYALPKSLSEQAKIAEAKRIMMQMMK